MTTAVLYHQNCPDGWTAAWVAHRALAANGAGVDLIPVSHGAPPPDMAGVDELYIVDFAYPHQDLVALAEGRRVVVLDHHRSAIDDIAQGLDITAPDGRTTIDAPYHCVLDVNRSGAGITWDFFHPGEPRPPLVDYVEDRDLWRWRLPHSKTVSAWIQCQPYALDTWDKISKASVPAMADEGLGVLMHIDAYCRAAANHAYMCEMGDRVFPIVNVTYEACSEVAAHLLDVFEVDMAGYFFQTGAGRWQYGFRSRNGTTVHDHAMAFGGGGHEKAAGCTVDEIVHTRVEP